MKVRHSFWVSLVLATLSFQAYAQTNAPLDPYEEYGKHLRAAQEVTPLTSTMFGDQVSLYNGSTEFTVTDVDLPGNSSLPVRFGRRLTIDDRRQPTGSIAGLGDWDIEVPYIDGVFAAENGWQVQGANNTGTNSRCSVTTPPYTVVATVPEPTYSVWDGDQLHIPGETDEELLANTEAKLPAVGDGKTYPWITKSFYRASCVSTTANGYAGESFVVVSPHGVRTTFNWAVVKPTSQMTYQIANPDGGTNLIKGVANRSRIFLLATRIDDRFGNWVTYSYNSASQLTQIAANDGRSIHVTWSGNSVASVTTGSRTWNYGYASDGSLHTVTRPDGSAWTYSTTSGSLATVKTPPDNEKPPSYHCQIDPYPNTGGLVYTIGAPSGAQGTFTFTYQRNSRSYVPQSCTDANPDTVYPLVYDFFDNFALVSKQITGAGLVTQNWSYSYGANTLGYVTASVPYPLSSETYIPQSSAAYAAPKVVTVTDPSEVTKYSFGVNYGVDEGRLYKTEIDTLGGTVMKTVTNTFLADSAIASQSFPDNAGQSVQPIWKNPMVARIRPETLTVTTQDGDSYSRQTKAFDVFAHPTDVLRFNSIPGQSAIEETTTYFNAYPLWVVGLPQEVDNVTNGGDVVESQNGYSASDATLTSSARFGETLLTYTYNAQGLLAAFSDGNSQTTSLSNYYRGIPQLIHYPDNTSQTATVDDYGDILSVTDQNSHTENYGYNAVGWPTGISYPTGDEVAWYPTSYSFVYVNTPERGIGAGHWDRTITTGNNSVVTYFDAMLHPLLTDSSIAGVSGSDITASAGYDWKGQAIFASYPVQGSPNVGDSVLSLGTSHAYDVLGRVTQSQLDSELGKLTSTTAYLSGAGTQTTDPKNNVTTTYYQVFDEPSLEAPIKVVAPEGVTQTIARDPYGSPVSITQSGLYNGTETDSVQKTLVYDSYHRLCRTTEPESGSVVTHYDNANNPDWSASGLSITGTGCGQEQVLAAAQTTVTYDPMNRVKNITPPSGTYSTQYLYDPAGNLQWATYGTTVWNGAYNYRNMLTGESLNVVDQNALALGYAHDAYGNLSLIHYPNGENVSYAPDARGRPTQVGTYASQVGYFPNGAMASFTYGNGAKYAAQQNMRQLLSSFSYGTASTLNVSEALLYDNDGNITNVSDVNGGQRSKQFQYDGLNRLTNAVAPALWGTESYTYDPLNNLRTRLSAGQTSVYNYDATNRLLTITRAGSTVNSFGYDNRGNLINKNGVVLQFDQKDQLTQIMGLDGFAYDANGRRVQKVPASGAPTYYFYDHGGQLMYQYAPGAAQTTNFIYLGTKLIARDSTLQLAAPGAVSFDANPNNGSYTVSWGAVPAATTYTLQESANGGGWVTVYAGSAASVSLTGRAGGGYVYQVQGCSGSSCGGWTASATLGVKPALPTSVTVPSSLTFAPYVVSWTGSVGAINYTVQQSFNGGAWTTIGTGITTPSYSVTSAPGGTYAYQIAANNTYGTRGWTAPVTVSVTQVPATPTNFVFTTDSNGNTILTWDAMAWASSYQLTVYGTHGNLGTYIYNVGDPSFNVPGGNYKVEELAACSIAGCSAPVQVSGSKFGLVSTPGSAAATAAAAITKIKRMIGDTASSTSGCTATVCAAVIGGNP